MEIILSLLEKHLNDLLLENLDSIYLVYLKNNYFLAFLYNSNSALATFFKKQADVAVADSVLELFRNRENIENFNKKALYILIRDRTGVKTQYITRVVNIMKGIYVEMYRSYKITGIARIDKHSDFLE